MHELDREEVGMNPSEARQRLLGQHEWLRAMLEQTRVLARRFLAGEPVARALEADLLALREGYAAHNSYELSVLEPMLRDADAYGPVRIARMIEEHGAEHRALEEHVAGTTEEVALHFDDFADLVDAHMAAEERTFLSSQVLRDDIVSLGGPES
jgi:hypothetical protein